jgi:pentatricopeptide repeat protein
VAAEMAAMAPGIVQLHPFAWNQKLSKYVKDGQVEKAMQLFQQMQREGATPDKFTFIQAIKACACLGALQDGRLVHQQLIQSGCESDVFVGSSLVDMYAKCGSIEDAWRVFNKMPSRDVVTWTAMILGHVKCGQGQKALELFRQMQQEGVHPNYVTFVGVLNACASVIALEEGRCVHHHIVQSGLEMNVFVGNSLVDMYAKCGRIEDAWKVFHKMPSRDVVTWNAMVLGHVKCGHEQKALELFQQMQQEGVRPNSVTFVGVLNACASVIALEEGRRVHQQIIQSGLESDVFVGSSLVDMYAKCGSIEDACRVFNKMPSRDVVTWTAILGGFAMHGHGREALKHFEQMCDEGVQPDDITFVCVLSACSHAGLVDEGMCLYASMIRDYMIPAKLEHYTCMVDLLGRAGHLQEAENMVMAMPCKPQAAAWMALLGACRIHGNVGMAECVAKRILELEPENAAVYVLLSNIYAAAGNRHLCENVERQRKERGAKKQPGRTWIEVNNEVHTFVVQGQDHPQMIEIHAELQRLSGLMHNAGYVPCTELVLDDVEEEEKVSHLCHHSEKLAIAFGLINTAPGTPLRIRKNLRVCKDCHTSTKFISKIVRRTIMVRDANRFHHFEDGVCSCMDYW